MTFKRPYGAGLAALAVGLFATTAAYAEPTVNKGDNAWMLTSTVLVLLMTIPGLALFYGGLVRSKNMLSVLMQVFYTVCIVTVIWALYAFFAGRLGGKAFLGRDAFEVRHQRAGLDAAEVEPLAARQHGHRDLADLGRGEDEFGVRRRLLERLEQRVERRAREHVDFVEDVDLVAPAHRRVADRIVDLTHVVDAIV